MASKEQAGESDHTQTLRDRSVDVQRDQARTVAGQNPNEPREPNERTVAADARPYSNIGRNMAGGVSNIAGSVIGAVRDTANTAIDGVGSIGENVVHTVTGLLVEAVGGVRQIAGAAVGGTRRNQSHGGEAGPGDADEAVRREQSSRREANLEHTSH